MPTKTPWVWNESLQRYRSTETGRFLGPRQMLELRDVFAQAQRARTSELAARLTTGEITATAWQGEMKGIIKQTYIDQYVMAKGGRAQMTQADYGRVGRHAARSIQVPARLRVGHQGWQTITGTNRSAGESVRREQHASLRTGARGGARRAEIAGLSGRRQHAVPVELSLSLGDCAD